MYTRSTVYSTNRISKGWSFKVSTEEILEFIKEEYPDNLIMDGFDEAIVGLAHRCSDPVRVVYDQIKCIEILQEQGMTYDEASEYFYYNCQGSYLGETTPVFLENLRRI